MLREEYPDISEKVLEEIVLKGLKNFQTLIVKRMDVKIHNDIPGRQYQIVVTDPFKMVTQKDVNTRAKRLHERLKELRNKWIR